MMKRSDKTIKIGMLIALISAYFGFSCFIVSSATCSENFKDIILPFATSWEKDDPWGLENRVEFCRLFSSPRLERAK